jgi:hypothetical protein
VARIALALIGATLISCGGAVPANVSAPSPTASATTSPAVSASATGDRIEGTVATASATKLVLTDNTSLDVGPSTRIVRTDRATITDLKPGLFVAVTAKQQPDATLLASMVNVFPASSNVPAGQRPLPQGDLMTNAPIVSVDQVGSSSFTVTFPGGTAKVVLAPGAVITKQTDVKAQDIAAGTRIVALPRGGAVQSIQIQGE